MIVCTLGMEIVLKYFVKMGVHLAKNDRCKSGRGFVDIRREWPEAENENYKIVKS